MAWLGQTDTQTFCHSGQWISNNLAEQHGTGIPGHFKTSICIHVLSITNLCSHGWISCTVIQHYWRSICLHSNEISISCINFIYITQYVHNSMFHPNWCVVVFRGIISIMVVFTILNAIPQQSIWRNQWITPYTWLGWTAVESAKSLCRNTMTGSSHTIKRIRPEKENMLIIIYNTYINRRISDQIKAAGICIASGCHTVNLYNYS